MIGRYGLRSPLQRQCRSCEGLLAFASVPRRAFTTRFPPLLSKFQSKGDRFVRRGTPNLTPVSSFSVESEASAAVAAGIEGATASLSTAARSEIPASTNPASSTAPPVGSDVVPDERAAPSAPAQVVAPSPEPPIEENDPQSLPSAVAGDASPPPPPHKPQSGIQRLFASWQQGIVASIGAVMGIGFIIYLLYTPVKEDTVHHTAVVASEALKDIRLRGRALQFSKDIAANVLQDEQSLVLVVELVRKVLAQEDTKVAISSLLQSLFEDHYTQEVTKKFVLMIVRDPWIMDQLQVIAKEQVLRLLSDDAVKAALSAFMTQSATKSLNEPDLLYETARAVRKSIVNVVNPWC